MKKDDNLSKDKRTDYPHPNMQDRQQNNQPEFIDQQPNDFHDKTISDLPVNATEQDDKRGVKEEE